MASSYSNRYSRPIGTSEYALGEMGPNLDLQALVGEGDYHTCFDDFNGIMSAETFGDTAIWETSGWVLTDVGTPAADAISMNSAATATLPFDSCIRINAGTTADTGGNAQLDAVNASLPASGRTIFPHIWIAESGAGATVLDSTSFVFACRVGLISNATSWDGKMFIGWAEAGDVGLLTAATGAITITAGGPLVGFHVSEAGAIAGISLRDPTQAIAEGTNQEALTTVGTLTAGTPVWYDLALRMDITDMSDNAANGTTSFAWRQVTSGTNHVPWNVHGSVLSNVTPNNDIALVPSIEVANGPTNLSDVLVDWWVFGMSRFSR